MAFYRYESEDFRDKDRYERNYNPYDDHRDHGRMGQGYWNPDRMGYNHMDHDHMHHDHMHHDHMHHDHMHHDHMDHNNNCHCNNNRFYR